jgi:hypothetical protein
MVDYAMRAEQADRATALVAEAVRTVKPL